MSKVVTQDDVFSVFREYEARLKRLESALYTGQGSGGGGGGVGPPGPPGAVAVFEQPGQPTPNPNVGAVWIDTDAPDPGLLIGGTAFAFFNA